MAKDVFDDLGFQSFEDLGFQPDSTEEDKLIDSSALGAGIKQGGTLGFADEIGGGIQAGLDKLLGGVSDVDKQLVEQGFTGDLTPTTGDVYREARDKERQYYKEAEERAPGSYLLGNILGSLPSAGVAGAGTKGLIAGGAAYGLGGSKAELSDPTLSSVGEAAVDTLLGAGTAGLAPGAGKLALKSGKYLGKKALDIGKSVGDIPFIDDLLQRAKSEYKGVSVLGKKAADEATEQVQKSAEEIISGTKSTAESFIPQINQAISEAEEAGVKIDSQKFLGPIRDKLQAQLEKTESESIQTNLKEGIDFINKVISGKNASKSPIKTPSRLVELRRELQDPTVLKESPKIKSQIRQGFREAEESIPGLAEINKKSSDSRKALERLGLKENEDFFLDPITNEMTIAGDAAKKIENRIASSAKEGLSGAQAERYISEGLSFLESANPELAKKLKQPALDAAQRYRLAQTSSTGGLISSGAKTGASIIGKIGKESKSLAQKSPEALKQLASIMSSGAKAASKGTQHVAKEIANMAEKDKIGRNAAIFAMEQHPEFRKILKSLKGQDEEE